MSSRFLHLNESIQSLDHVLRQVKTRGTKDLGLKSSHTLILVLLADQPEGASFGWLTENSHYDAGLLSRTLQDLRSLELVEKCGEEGRYRQTYVLTETGQSKAAYITRRVDHAEDIVGRNISREDLDTFYKVAGQLQSNLQELAAKWRK